MLPLTVSLCLLAAFRQARCTPVGSPQEYDMYRQGHQEVGGDQSGLDDWFGGSDQPYYPQGAEVDAGVTNPHYTHVVEQGAPPYYSHQDSPRFLPPWGSHAGLPHHPMTQGQMDAIRRYMWIDEGSGSQATAEASHSHETEEGWPNQEDGAFVSRKRRKGVEESVVEPMEEDEEEGGEAEEEDEAHQEEGPSEEGARGDWKKNFPGGRPIRANEMYCRLAHVKKTTARIHLDRVNDQGLIAQLLVDDPHIQGAALEQIRHINRKPESKPKGAPSKTKTLLGEEYAPIMEAIKLRAGVSRTWASKMVNPIMTKDIAGTLLDPQTRDVAIQCLVEYIQGKHLEEDDDGGEDGSG